MANPLDYVNGPPAAGMNPYLLMGLGILGQSNQPGLAGIGSGALQGMLMSQQMQQANLENQVARQNLAQASRWRDFVAEQPEDRRELLRALGPEAGAAYITKMDLEAAKQAGGGAWEGTGIMAQALNTYNQLKPKVDAGVPLSPEEQNNFAFSQQILTQPKTLTTAEGTYTYPGMTLPGMPPVAGAPGVVGPGPAAGAGPPAFTPKPATEGERKAASWYGRMESANQALAELEGLEDFDPAAFSGRAVKDFIGGRMAESSGPLTAILGSLITSDEYNLYTSAAGDFIASLLRYESGAAVPDTEFYRYYSIYFPMPGQGPAVRAAKAERRRQANEALRTSAARGLSEADRRKKGREVSKQVAKEVPLPQASAAPAAPIDPTAPQETEKEVFF